MTSIQNLYSSLFLRLLISFCLCATPGFAARDVLFEGYHKVLSGKQHVGFSVARYEYDSATKRFHAAIFVKLGALAGNAMESIKAVSDQNLTPISYEYTTLVLEGNKQITKKINATFKMFKLTKKEQDKVKKTLKKGEEVPKEMLKMTATVEENGKTSRIIEDLPRGTFLSYFLVYLMLKSKSGIQTDSRYDYRAIAEEKPKLVNGLAVVRKEAEHLGVKTYVVENEFSDQKFISYVTDKGHVIGVVNPSQSIETQLMAKPVEAVGEFNVPTIVLKNLFGEVPLGVENIISAKLKAEALAPVTEPAGSKQYGAPPGKGILTKPSDSAPGESTGEATSEPTVEKMEKQVPVEKPKDKK